MSKNLSSHHDPIQRKKRIIRAALVFCPIAIVFSAYIFYIKDYLVAERQLSTQLARAKRLGLPLEANDLRKAPIPEEKNAYPILKQAFSQGHRLDLKSKTLKEIARKLAADEFKKAKKEASQFQPYLELIIQASRKPQCDFGWKFEDGYKLEFPEFLELGTAVKLLGIQAEIAAAENKTTESLQYLRCAKRIERFLQGEPFLIVCLVQVTTEKDFLKAIERCSNRQPKNKAFLKELAQEVATLGPLPDFKNAIRGEAFFSLDAAKKFHRYSVSEILEDMDMDVKDALTLSPPLVPKTLLGKAYLTRAAEALADLFDSMERCGWDLNQWDVLANKQITKIESSGDRAQRWNQLTFSIFANAPKAILRLESQRQSTKDHLRFLIYKAQNSR